MTATYRRRTDRERARFGLAWRAAALVAARYADWLADRRGTK